MVSTFNLGKEFFRPSLELVLVVAAGLGILVLGLNPALILVAGGAIGAFAIREARAEDGQ